MANHNALASALMGRNALSGIVSTNWLGASGKRYQFQNHPIGTAFASDAGVYIFCKAGANGTWNAVYVGETDDFSRRISNELGQHHAWNCIIACGATHICTLPVQGGDADRVAVETDLRHSLNPPCNKQ
jgi:hypothetical protein